LHDTPSRGQLRGYEYARPDGGTLLVGTTWYRHHMQPAGYWRVWSDQLVHRIHLSVLSHVK